MHKGRDQTSPLSSPRPGLNHGLKQEIPETVQIKEEPEEQSIKQEEEQLPVCVPEYFAVVVKTEESSLLQQNEPKKETQGEDISAQPQLHPETEGDDTEHSSDIDNEEDWRAPFSWSDDEDQVGAISTTAQNSGLSPEYKSAPETSATVSNGDESGTAKGAKGKTQQCPFCTKIIKGKKGSLERHIRIHTGERPYSCSTYNKTFARTKATPLSRQGKQQRKFAIRQVLEQLEADDSDFSPELDSDSDSGELFQSHESDVGESSAQDNDSPSDEDVPFAETASPQMEPNRAAKTYKWQKKGFELPDVNFQGEQIESYHNATTDTPLVYFRRFVSLDMLENIVEHTNLHSIQKHGKCVDTSVKEIEQVLGMYLRMGLVQMSGVRQYWESEVRYGPVADIMSRNRFNLLLSVIHFVDNEMASEEVKKDRLWKLRPFLDSFRRQCLTIAPLQKQSIDEMTVLYKGKFGGIREYIKEKPHPWGFTVWARCCVSGLLHDFDIYQGKGGGNEQKGKSQLGIGGDIVVKLCESLAEKVHFLIFADSFFTSMPLIEKLLAKGIYYTGTVRKKHMSKCNLMTDKDLSKKGCGSYDYRIESNTNTVCLKWQDTKAVSLMSTYAGPEPLGKARRWDKSKKDYINIDQPNIIKEYNSSVGGVDMLDAHLACCKFPIRTRRWYMILFWHFLSVAVINAWLLYQHDCEAQGITGSKVLKLRKFQGLVAQGLVEVGKARRRGRSPTLDPSFLPPPRCVRVYQSADVRFDQIAHWPVKEENRRRCAVCKDLKTEMHCEKCAVPLCINKKRNCFKDYHNV